MLENILNPLIQFIHSAVSGWGAAGIMFLMAIESANIPLPSEAILPYAGFLVSEGMMSIHTAALAGALGCVLGSIPSYALGYFGGRPIVEKYGKWLMISKKDLDTADRWVEKYGDWTFFICRMLPIVRTFISLPAGILRAHFLPFIGLTFIGSLVWSYVLVFAGIKVGENLELFIKIWHKFDLAIVVVFGGLFVWYLIKHINHGRK
jgi:membrane protein DedA with SNARE-associated domain